MSGEENIGASAKVKKHVQLPESTGSMRRRSKKRMRNMSTQEALMCGKKKSNRRSYAACLEKVSGLVQQNDSIGALSTIVDCSSRSVKSSPMNCSIGLTAISSGSILVRHAL